MKRVLLYVAVTASLAFTATALADGSPPTIPGPTQPTTISASDPSGGPSQITLFGTVCQVDAISYHLLAQTQLFVVFTATRHCLDGSVPPGLWLASGKSLDLHSYQTVLKIPMSYIGKRFSISYQLVTPGGTVRCGFNPNFKFGYTNTKRCH